MTLPLDDLFEDLNTFCAGFLGASSQAVLATQKTRRETRSCSSRNFICYAARSAKNRLLADLDTQEGSAHGVVFCLVYRPVHYVNVYDTGKKETIANIWTIPYLSTEPSLRIKSRVVVARGGLRSSGPAAD